jgi:hypothetical protein
LLPLKVDTKLYIRRSNTSVLSKFCPIKFNLRWAKRLFRGLLLLFFNELDVGLLTIYDMCKAADRGMVMTEIKLLEKHGGKSGDWTI